MKRFIMYLAIVVPALQIGMLAEAYTIPGTGQNKCYNSQGNEILCPSAGEAYYGQDATYQINQKSFTKLDSNGNDLPDSATSWAMVRDNITGLVWETKNSKDGVKSYNNPNDADNTYSWYDPTVSNPGSPGNGTDTNDFLEALNTSTFGGYSDWRLPTILELNHLLNYGDQFKDKNEGTVAINTHYFPYSQLFFYWTSTTFAYAPDGSWAIQISDGTDYYPSKTSMLYARAVRGTIYHNNFVDNGDGTVTDNATGLMWQKSSSCDLTWEAALSYCENSELAGYTDWRLPNINELVSIVNPEKYDFAVYDIFLNDTKRNDYWSSTTFSNCLWTYDDHHNYEYSCYSYSAWGIEFTLGTKVTLPKAYKKCVRAVRGGKQDIKKIGVDPGYQQFILTPDDKVSLYINSSNVYGHKPVDQYLPFMTISSGNPAPINLLSDAGIIPLDTAMADMHSYTFSFDPSGLTLLGMVSMRDLGLNSGDAFLYAYAYQNPEGNPVFVMDNLVYIVVK